MDRGAWWAAVHGVVKSRTWLSDFTFTFHFHALEKEMATHYNILAWRIPETGEPGGLPSMGSHRLGHDWSDLAAVAAEVGRGRCGYMRATWGPLCSDCSVPSVWHWSRDAHMWQYCRHTSACKTGKMWKRSVNCINVNFLVVILYWSYARCSHWRQLGEVYTGSLCINIVS